ncbi:hypothetical protein EV426DRAFT_616466 [Tirmania nivea]|nr:hypothetical protein EV426DRAFT_616466 [Tirmania nivea]
MFAHLPPSRLYTSIVYHTMFMQQKNALIAKGLTVLAPLSRFMSTRKPPVVATNHYRIEYSTSPNSKCRTCKELIPQKSLRLGRWLRATGKGFDGYYHWRHWGCVHEDQLRNLERKAPNMPKGFPNLTGKDQNRVKVAVTSMKLSDEDRIVKVGRKTNVDLSKKGVKVKGQDGVAITMGMEEKKEEVVEGGKEGCTKRLQHDCSKGASTTI